MVQECRKFHLCRGPELSTPLRCTSHTLSTILTSTYARNHNHCSLCHYGLHYVITLQFAPLATLCSTPAPPPDWLKTLPATTNWFWVSSLYGRTGAPASPCNTSNARVARDKLWCIFLSSPRDGHVGRRCRVLIVISPGGGRGIAGMRGCYKET